MIESVYLTLPTWRSFNPRSDVKKNSWFRLEYSMLDDPDFYNFTHEEFKAWIYILAQACRKNSENIRVNFEHADRTTRISRKGMISAISKLEDLGLVLSFPEEENTSTNVNVTDTLRVRDEHDTSTNATYERTDVRDETRQNKRKAARSAPELPPLAELWNENCGEFAKVTACGNTRMPLVRARWEENSDPAFWQTVILRIRRSDFCRGLNDRKWRADFDFLIRPDTANRVLEGKYDNKGGLPTVPAALPPLPKLSETKTPTQAEVEARLEDIRRGAPVSLERNSIGQVVIRTEARECELQVVYRQHAKGEIGEREYLLYNASWRAQNLNLFRWRTYPEMPEMVRTYLNQRFENRMGYEPGYARQLGQWFNSITTVFHENDFNRIQFAIEAKRLRDAGLIQYADRLDAHLRGYVNAPFPADDYRITLAVKAMDANDRTKGGRST